MSAKNSKVKTKKTTTKTRKHGKSSKKKTALIVIFSILGVFGLLVMGHFIYKSCSTKKQIYNVKIIQPTESQWELKVNGQKDEVNVEYGAALQVTVRSVVDEANNYSLLDSYHSDNAQLFCAKITNQVNPEEVVTESSVLSYDETEKLYKVSLFVTWKDYPKTFLSLSQKTDFENEIYTKDSETGEVKYVYDETLYGASNENIYYYDCTVTPVVQKYVSRSLFNENITIGDKIEVLPENFLSSCTNFNSTITFNGNSLRTIGKNFLYGCVSFNQEIVLPESLTTIADGGFMYGCKSFNQPFDTKNLQNVGADFLMYCTNFNSTITIGSPLKIIESNFLFGCTSFNKDIIIPETILNIGDIFMGHCDSMISTITINCPKSAFNFNSKRVCSTNIRTAPSFVQGIKINGTYATEWTQQFPYLCEEESADVVYRNLIKIV